MDYEKRCKIIPASKKSENEIEQILEKLQEKYPFMGYEHGSVKYLSIMGKDTGIKINSPRLVKKHLSKRKEFIQ